MPNNLNALIRYITIDSCLRNKYTPCTRLLLREKCTSAINESKKINKLVSERTIYDDLRIMKSDILGFNAPIVQKNGVYSYEDSNFSLFHFPDRDVRLLEDILNFLINDLPYPPMDKAQELINRLSTIVGYPVRTTKHDKKVISYLSIKSEIQKKIELLYFINEFHKIMNKNRF